MPALHRSVATLRVSGETLEPSEISRLLGCAPTESCRKGEMRSTNSAIAARTGMWRLDATPTEPEDLAGQVAELVGKLTQDLEIWRQLSDSWKVDIFCGWFMAGGDEGVNIPAETLREMSCRCISLAVCIYGPDVGV